MPCFHVSRRYDGTGRMRESKRIKSYIFSPLNSTSSLLFHSAINEDSYATLKTCTSVNAAHPHSHFIFVIVIVLVIIAGRHQKRSQLTVVQETHISSLLQVKMIHVQKWGENAVINHEKFFLLFYVCL